MKTLTRHLLFLVPFVTGTPHLQAAWTFETISNAAAGSLASRVVMGGERTLIAYRSGSALMAAWSTGGALVPETILANATPSNIFVSVGTRGVGLVSYWDGTKYRFAIQVSAGSGNCGLSSNWQCGHVGVPAGMSGQVIDKIVGQADALGTAHFIYRIRTSSGPFNAMYYSTRLASGTLTLPVEITWYEDHFAPNHSPVAIEVVSSTAISFMSVGDGRAVIGGKGQNGFYFGTGFVPGYTFTSGDMDKKHVPTKFCLSEDWYYGSGAPAGTAEIIYTLRDANNGVWLGTQTVLAPFEYGRHHCSIQVKASGVPAVAYTTHTDIVRVWRLGGLNEIVDASGVFVKPILELTPADKLLILYHGPGYLKFGREQ